MQLRYTRAMSPTARRSQAGRSGSATATNMLISMLVLSSMTPTGAHGAHNALRVDLEGEEGHWTESALCPPVGQTHGKVVDFIAQIEKHEHLIDDTALNGVKMKCDDGSIIGFDGDWGEWGEWRSECPEGFTAFKFQLQHREHEEPQNFWEELANIFDSVITDDTAGNDLHMLCPGGFTNEACSGSECWRSGRQAAMHGEGEGDWSSAAPCPEGQYVCGLKLKVEPWHWSFDATATNAVRLQCCPAPSAPGASSSGEGDAGDAHLTDDENGQPGGMGRPEGGRDGDRDHDGGPHRDHEDDDRSHHGDRDDADDDDDHTRNGKRYGHDDDDDDGHDDDDDDGGGGVPAGALAGAAALGLVIGGAVAALMCTRRRAAQQANALVAMDAMKDKKEASARHGAADTYDAEAGMGARTMGPAGSLLMVDLTDPHAPEEPALGQPALGTGAFEVAIPANTAPGTVLQVMVPDGHPCAGQAVPFCVPSGFPAEGGRVMVPLPVVNI
mmetsp:Transcript_317/g.721  ORF Transcript_317/g.721 Transcript_317/m.721 type:complete len:499 (-) Transcript_317:172-1668(-)|eukprot:CAMPEP_0118935240 /NCGR_PEP_ID=MMETSP1169-20130426/15238_1 /TAXON_ID=36882 /ORGANISM="Pyramimonas obovata, Strain CCMP722" /LENGTH=498 /DNA_ID=CAMNT_0006878249 /DNA_START=235 /DNA_END=1731 /DNA_ORIENTATION=-